MIPYSIFLIPFLVVVIFFVAMAGSALYHIVRFDFVTRTTLTALALFVGGTLIILGISFYYFRTIPWSDGVSLRVPSSQSQTDNSSNPLIDF